MSAITLDNITKTYNKGAVLAVDKATFDVAEGETFGLIGPDGAGKTSIFRVLTTLLLPDGGNATVAGFDVIKDYAKIRDWRRTLTFLQPYLIPALKRTMH